MFLEQKYIQLLSGSLKKFTRKSTNIWNFDCPLCTDTRKRGYMLFKKGSYYSYCHNCGISKPFGQFLETVNRILYGEYIVERFSGDPNERKQVVAVPSVEKKSKENKILLKLHKVSLLQPNHPAKRLMVKRQIPTFYHSRLYYAPNFNKFARQITDEEHNEETKWSKKIVEPRLVIPMFDKFKRLIGVQGRALGDVPHKLRYITVMLSPDNPRFFGLDTVEYQRKYYVFQVPFDSMFIENSLAVCGGAIHVELKKHSLIKPTCVVVYDNEPRNKDVVRNMMKVARAGYQICVWPESTEEKDINDMILSRIGVGERVNTELVQFTGEYIKDIIDNNTFQGLEAERRITEWKRC